MAKYALVIGIPEYQSFASLPNTTADAEAIAQLLENQGHFQEVKRLPERWNIAKNGYEVAPQGLTGKTLGDTLKTFLLEQAVQSDAVIYFTGHGFTISDNLGQQSGYLATTDCGIDWEGDRAVGQRYGISLDSLNALIQQANLSSLVMLLDCCHSGFFIEQSIISQSLTILAQKDYYLITSSRQFESSWSGEKHSVFTEALIGSLLSSNAGSDGYVTVDRVFDFIQRQLRNSGQEPVRFGWGRSIGLIHYPPSQSREQITPLNPQNPYLGLKAFEGKNSAYFYGRETAIYALLERLQKGRFLSVIGASGCGKSSLVKAGLIPKLQDDPLPNSQQWAIAQFTPGDRPLHRLLDTLAPLHNQNQPFLLFIDQFEEIFTQCKDESNRRDFFRLIAEEATTTERQGRVIVAVRGDFLDRCAEYNEIATLINRTQPTTYFVEPLSLSELEAAIVKPAQQHGVKIEPGLAAQMAEDVAHQPGALPLLQYALRELWRVCIAEADSTHPYLTWTGYEQIGEVGGALEKRANLIYNSFGQECDRDLVRRLSLELVELGDGDTVVRRRQSQKSLSAIADSPEQLQTILERLSQERLIVISTEKTGENSFENYVEVTHEALLCRWELLKTWIDQNRDNIRLKRRFEADCLAWRDRYQQSEDALLTGLWLSDIVTWKEQENPRLLPAEHQFIAQSIARRDREFQDKLNQERNLREEAEARAKAESEKAQEAQARVKIQKQKTKWAIAAILGIICTSGLGLVTQLIHYEKQKTDLSTIVNLISKAEYSLASGDQLEATFASIESLSEMINTNQRNRNLIKDLYAVIQKIQLISLLDIHHSRNIDGLSFSPDGKYLVSGDDEGNITIWNTVTNEVKYPSEIPQQKYIQDIEFSPDGKFFASTGIDGLVKIFDFESTQVKDTLENHIDLTFSISIDSKSQLIAISSRDNTISIQSLKNNHNTKVNILPERGSSQTNARIPIHDVIFNPKSSSEIFFTSGMYNYDLIKYKYDNQNQKYKETNRYGDGQNTTTAIAFRNEGNLLAYGNSQGEVIICDNDLNFITKFTAFEDLITDIDFSYNGTYLAVSSDSGVIKIYETYNISDNDKHQKLDKMPILLNTGNVAINRIKFHPKHENILASSNENGLVNIWSITGISISQNQKELETVKSKLCDRVKEKFKFAEYDINTAKLNKQKEVINQNCQNSTNNILEEDGS